MRSGGSKSKGGAYELIICRKIALAFKSLGIKEDDCYRTKNSGATKRQPGDIQFSPRFAKLFPVLIECKHYRSISYKLGKDLSAQPKSYVICKWWLQVIREQKERKDKKAILVFRQNNCSDLILLTREHFRELTLSRPENFMGWFMMTNWKHKSSLIMLSLEEFLIRVVIACKAQKRNNIKALRIIKQR
jgi:hypothetical protein